MQGRSVSRRSCFKIIYERLTSDCYGTGQMNLLGLIFPFLPSFTSTLYIPQKPVEIKDPSANSKSQIANRIPSA